MQVLDNLKTLSNDAQCKKSRSEGPFMRIFRHGIQPSRYPRSVGPVPWITQHFIFSCFPRLTTRCIWCYFLPASGQIVGGISMKADRRHRRPLPPVQRQILHDLHVRGVPAGSTLADPTAGSTWPQQCCTGGGGHPAVSNYLSVS